MLHKPETNTLFKDVLNFKIKLFNNLVKNNPSRSSLILLKKSQKLIDRFLFILFDFLNDDFTKLPQSLQNIINDPEKRKKLVIYINPPYAEASDKKTLRGKEGKSAVEQSLKDIEKITLKKTSGTYLKEIRKKDGIFYTPPFITRYIIENTLGKLCEDKKKELKLNNLNSLNKQGLKRFNKQGLKRFNKYRIWLLNLKIVDPACGGLGDKCVRYKKKISILCLYLKYL